MTLESQLREVLHRVEAQVPNDHGRLSIVRVRGRRRRLVTRATSGAVGVFAVAAGLAVLSQLLPPDGPDAVGPLAGIEAAQITLCDGRRCPAISADDLDALRARLTEDPNVVEVRYESAEQAHARMRGPVSGADDVAGEVTVEMFTASFFVTVVDGGQLVAVYADDPRIEAITVPE